ncbi:MAG: O-antigen ligase family protein, partial [Planctomycetota bacterium]|nr:O-antigen ligase family protein [Planctomycetota bacterium]
MAKKRKSDRRSRSAAQTETHANGESAVSPFAGWLPLAVQVITLGLVVAAPLVSEGAAEQFSNWILFFFWLLAIAAWLAGRILTGQNGWVCGRVDFCFYGVCGWALASGGCTLAYGLGHSRPTLNACWQWVGFAVAFFLLRQLAGNREFSRALIWGTVLIAIGCSVAGIYQRWVVYPEMWKTYQAQSEEQKQQTLRQGGLGNVEAGSRERVMWENRLRATEPTSTFVLANSLASFLVPSILILGMFCFAARQSLAGSSQVVGWLAMLVLGACLVLTKSRTAYLACLAGLVGWGILKTFTGKQGIPWKTVLIGGAGMFLVVLLAFLGGVLDKQVITEAGKSFTYRLEYWQASMELIRNRPLFGAGPGNFQHAYAGYQLVQSSETVADPHNFLIEVGAVCGLPAAFLMLAGMVTWCVRWIRSLGEKAVSQPRAGEGEALKKNSPRVGLQVLLLPAGIAAGLLLALVSAAINGTELGLVLISGLVALLLVAAVRPFDPEGTSWAAGIGLLAWGLALSASGGISFPPVAMTGIVLLVVSLSEMETSSRSVAGEFPVSGPGKKPVLSLVLLFLILGMIVLFRSTVYDPIRLAGQQARIASLDASNGRLQPALERLDKAIQADPHDGNLLFFRLQMLFRKFQLNPDKENLEELVESADRGILFRPNNSKVALETGKIFLA